jgi:hypothetical protein
MDRGDLLSEFYIVADYVFKQNGFQFIVDSIANNMQAGLYYRFRIRARNDLGFSAFSDTLMVGLGPKPSTLSTPIRSLDESKNSATSIKVEWS